MTINCGEGAVLSLRGSNSDIYGVGWGVGAGGQIEFGPTYVIYIMYMLANSYLRNTMI